MNENKAEESRGYWEYNRIGRPDVAIDQRTKYTANVDEFAKAMKERKQIYSRQEKPVQEDHFLQPATD